MIVRINQLLTIWGLSIFVLASCTAANPTGAAATTAGAAATQTTPATPNNQAPNLIETQPSSLATAGWGQYVSTNMQIAIAYPPDWSVTENNGEVIFTSPGGATIRLDQVQAGGMSPQDFLNQDQLPNTRCSSGENPDSVQYRSCFDTVAFSTTAYLVINSPQGSPRFFTLSAFARSDLGVFDTMLASSHAS
jgi:hypothetical protein